VDYRSPVKSDVCALFPVLCVSALGLSVAVKKENSSAGWKALRGLLAGAALTRNNPLAGTYVLLAQSPTPPTKFSAPLCSALLCCCSVQYLHSQPRPNIESTSL